MKPVKRALGGLLGVLLIVVGVMLAGNLYLEYSYRSYCRTALQAGLEAAIELGDEAEIARHREALNDANRCRML